MSIQKLKWHAQCNFTQYKNQKAGFYESYFIRGNHPSEAKAFWIRYTIFSPKKRPDEAIAEVWAVWFDRENKSHFALKSEEPLSGATFSNTHFKVAFRNAQINNRFASGNIQSTQGEISWELEYQSEEFPVFLFPLGSYDAPFPKAKALVSLPMAEFKGSIQVNGEEIDVSGWIGSQNHNWGEKHTDHYAWGQVAGFDNAPNSFLEIGSGRLRLFNSLQTPFLTPIVLRHEGKEYALNSWGNILRSKVSLNYYEWTFKSENKQVKIHGTIKAHADDFVGLTYYNPPGGNKFCLNSKIASCEIYIEEKSRIGLSDVLTAKHRAAFEILTDDSNHGIKMYI